MCINTATHVYVTMRCLGEQWKVTDEWFSHPNDRQATCLLWKERGRQLDAANELKQKIPSISVAGSNVVQICFSASKPKHDPADCPPCISIMKTISA